MMILMKEINKFKIAEFNEIAYTELILSIDVKRRNGKIAFNLIEGFKNKEDDNAASAYERYKIIYEPIFAPKVGKAIWASTLMKNQDPDVWIT